RPRIQGWRVGCPHLRGSRITDRFRHHPDDRAGNAVDRHDRAQHAAVAPETPLPQTPAENDQAVFARLVLAGHERASQRWTQSECFEVVGRDLHALHALRSLAAGDVAGPPYEMESTRLNSSNVAISYAVLCLKKKRARRANAGVGYLPR